MASSYMEVLFKGEVIRTFGGNKKEIREELKRYESPEYKKMKHPFVKEHEYVYIITKGIR